MKKFKKLILTLMLLVCSVMLCGCASVTYSVVETENGGVGQSLEIELNEKQLISAGATVAQIQTMKGDIARIMTTKQNEICQAFQTRVNQDKSLTGTQKEMLLNGVETGVQTQGSTIEVAFLFSNSVVYYYFYEIDPSESSGDVDEKKESLFFSKFIESSKTIYSNQDLVNSYMDAARQYLSELGLTNPDNIKQPQFFYSYKTQNLRLRSDADQKSVNGSEATHTWLIDADQTQREIHFYVVQPRRAIWYIFALGGAIVLCGVLFVVNYFKTKKSKKDEVEIIEPK